MVLHGQSLETLLCEPTDAGYRALQQETICEEAASGGTIIRHGMHVRVFCDSGCGEHEVCLDSVVEKRQEDTEESEYSIQERK
jgi:hypothetical protein